MTADQADLLAEARKSVNAARLLADAGYSGYAAARAYYAMFYVSEALLEGEGLAFSKHSAVIAAFGRHFAHTQKVPAEFHRFLIDAERLRLSGDYTGSESVTEAQAHEQIARAEQFIAVAERLLG